MNAQVRIENPMEVEVTIAITMKIKEWERLQKQLSGENHPAWEFRKVITKLINRARETFCEKQEENDE